MNLKRGIKQKVFLRTCRICGREFGYTNKKTRDKMERLNRSCAKCVAKEIQNRPEIVKKKSERMKICSLGEKNSFYGKHHTEESKNKIRNNTDYSYTQTKEFKEKSRRPGKLNGMYGRSFYDVWLEKYGKEEADKKFAILCKKHSISVSGKKNGMYGKPAPKGAGSGWSGWYKKWYFRSLKELSYMIQVIEKNNYKWSSAETKKLQIKYKDYDGTDRTYRADFIINDKTIVEVKPKRLMETVNNRLKKDAAIKFCKENGYKYVMVDVKTLDINKIIDLHKCSLIRFTKKYEERLEKITCKLAKKKK